VGEAARYAAAALAFHLLHLAHHRFRCAAFQHLYLQHLPELLQELVTLTAFTPAPFVLGVRRLLLRMSGFGRSCFVIESIVASFHYSDLARAGPALWPQ
jgi:hypothetical protein